MPSQASQAKEYFEKERRRRIQRRKAEEEFLRGMQYNSKISHLEEIEQQMIEDDTKRKAPPPAPLPKPETKADISAVVAMNTFEGPVRCLEITHGGCTAWTGEADGTIGIRNGVSGKLAYIIDKTDDKQVDSLFATDTHMWVGMSDGTVRIYDHLVYILAFEDKQHSDSVTAFAASFDGQIFSASLDCSLVKWDNDINSFSVAGKCSDNAQKIRALACYGYNLFVAGDGGIIQCLDTETWSQIQIFEGHTSRINALLVHDGFLFSGSDDKRIIVWRTDIAQPVNVWENPTSAITCFHIDTVAYQLWVGDAAGFIHIFDSPPMKTFALAQSFGCEGSPRVLSLKGVVIIDTIKVWSIGSNGLNKVWHASKNKLELCVQSAVDAMNSIIAEDVVELARWAELIQTTELIADRLVKSMTTTLAVATRRSTQRTWFLRWLMAFHRKFLMRRYKLLVGRMHTVARHNLARRYFTKFSGFMNKQHRRAQATALSKRLEMNTRHSLLLSCFLKLQMHILHRRILSNRTHFADSMMQSTERRLAGRYFLTWQHFLATQRAAGAKKCMAMAYLLHTVMSSRNVFYHRWLSWLDRKKFRKSNMKAVVMMLKGGTQLTCSEAWNKWAKLVERHRSSKHRSFVSGHLSKSTNADYLRRFYFIWERFAKVRTASKLEEVAERNRVEMLGLADKVKDIEHFFRRRKLVDAAQGAIDQTLAQRIQLQMRMADLEEELKKLHLRIEEKRNAGTKRAKQMSLAEQLDDILSQLKCKTINLHRDFGLIDNTLKKVKGHAGGVVKCFLEAHIEVKRHIVEMTHNPNINPNEPWPFTIDEMKKQLKPHFIEPMLQSIRVMAIAFDMMTLEERSGIITDKEIVMNGQLLIDMADYFVFARTARLRRMSPQRK